MNNPLLLPAGSTRAHSRPESRVNASSTNLPKASNPQEVATAGGRSAADLADLAPAETLPATELILVEGKSAQQAMDRIRNRQFQAIFRMQGKIPNPALVKPARIHAHEHCAALISLLQAEHATEQYQQVVIVPDPDVDGAHSGYLLISLFKHYLPEWLARRAVYLFRTPLSRIETATTQGQQPTSGARYLYSAEEIRDWLPQKAAHETLSHFKGLASMKTDELADLVSYPVTANPLCQLIAPEAQPSGAKS